MCEAAAKVIGVPIREDLGLAGHPPEGTRKGNPAAVALERSAIGVHIFRVIPCSKWVLLAGAFNGARGEIDRSWFQLGDRGLDHKTSLDQPALRRGYFPIFANTVRDPAIAFVSPS